MSYTGTEVEYIETLKPFPNLKIATANLATTQQGLSQGWTQLSTKNSFYYNSQLK